MLRLFSRRFPFPDYLNASSVELFRGESAELSFLISSRLQSTGGDLEGRGKNWGCLRIDTTKREESLLGRSDWTRDENFN